MNDLELRIYLREYLGSFLTNDHNRVYISLFVKFLKDEHLLEEFIFERKKYVNSINTIIIMKSYNPTEFLFKAFGWSNTQLGYGFWDRTNDAWLRFLALYRTKLWGYLKFIINEK